MTTGRLAAAVLAGLLLATGVIATFPVPGGAAAGTAAAEPVGGGNGPARAAEGTHALQSGDDHWQGRRLEFDGNRIVEDPGSAPADERTFGIWSVSDGDEVDTRMATFTIDRDGHATVRTDLLSGRFVVRYDGAPVYVEDGVGYRSPPSGDGPATVNESAWTVRKQTLSVEWTDDTVYNGQATRLVLDSNREASTVAVTAEGVGFENLTRIFPDETWAPNYDARREEDALLLSVSDHAEYALNVVGLPAGVSVFRFDVTDTTGRAKAGLIVRRTPAENRLLDVERSEQTGDVVATTVKCDHCYLMVGGRNQSVFDIVELSDRNGDGVIPIEINTRYAGMDPGSQDVPDTVDPYVAPEDSAERLPTSEDVTPPGLLSAYVLGEVRSDFGIPPQGRSEPLAPGVYDLTVTSTKYVDVEITSNERYPVRRYTIRDETHVQTIRLTEPSLEGVETGVAPGDVGEQMSLAAVEERTTRSDRVAVGDRLVVSVDVSGVFGYLMAVHGNDLRGVLDNDNEGIDLSLREMSTSDPNLVDLAEARTQLLVDPADDRLYVVVRTQSIRHSRPIEPGETYRVTFALSGEDGYPYLPDDARHELGREVRVVAPDTNLTARSVGDDRVALSGTATLAPGTVLAVTASTRGSSPWKRTTGVVTGADGAWRETIDFSDAPGDEFAVEVSYRGRRIAEIDGLNLSRAPTPADTGTPAAESSTGTARSPAGDGDSSGTTRSGPPTTGGSTTTPSADGSGPADGRSGDGAPFVPAIPRIDGVLSLAVLSAPGLGLVAFVVLRVIG